MIVLAVAVVVYAVCSAGLLWLKFVGADPLGARLSRGGVALGYVLFVLLVPSTLVWMAYPVLFSGGNFWLRMAISFAVFTGFMADCLFLRRVKRHGSGFFSATEVVGIIDAYIKARTGTWIEVIKQGDAVRLKCPDGQRYLRFSPGQNFYCMLLGLYLRTSLPLPSPRIPELQEELSRFIAFKIARDKRGAYTFGRKLRPE